MVKNMDIFTESVGTKENNEVDLDQALSVAGIGWYNIKYSLVLSLFLMSVVVELFGYSYILPAAKCDLHMSDAQRGSVGSIPYIGIVITSFPWGFLVDTRGRKAMIVYSSLAAGAFGAIAAFMPDLISFTIFKMLSSLCVVCPAAVPYTFIGEILPKRYRDLTLSIVNAMQLIGLAIVPLLAWAILPLNFKIDFGTYYFRSWRLLTLIYSSFFFISAILMSFGPESPKYLISQGKHDESLHVLRIIYSCNKNISPLCYPVKSLKTLAETGTTKPSFFNSLIIQTKPLLKFQYLKWLILTGALFFGAAMINGLYIFLPDVLNRVLAGRSDEGVIACDIISKKINQTTAETTVCDDSIERITFLVNTVAYLSCAFVALGVSSTVKLLGKQTLLVLVYIIIGIFCILINFVTKNIVFTVLLSSVPLMGLVVGPINAYVVEIFPTNVRGMAVSLTMMVGRCGSIVGTNITGVLINDFCRSTFYLLGGIFIFCGVLSSLLPKSRTTPKKPNLQKINGLYIILPDVLNNVLAGRSDEGAIACDYIEKD